MTDLVKTLKSFLRILKTSLREETPKKKTAKSTVR